MATEGEEFGPHSGMGAGLVLFRNQGVTWGCKISIVPFNV